MQKNSEYELKTIQKNLEYNIMITKFKLYENLLDINNGKYFVYDTDKDLFIFEIKEMLENDRIIASKLYFSANRISELEPSLNDYEYTMHMGNGWMECVILQTDKLEDAVNYCKIITANKFKI